ncbi:type II toxin-antitoxin system Phd/YefM family antitoxin [Sandaracinobacteroides saxicola]|uniref:Antitoxin n=1 Tax=Sandaracinobacteroides saxicola TaxID=2759707 RepID=A0A7G5IKB7_9SPHN|nr:type II toxin-antitoxin system prevent-host-death family antitoxin [Sandaracinobacteroides saxicola]QMW23809.1 type II toxin-antitoxin system prevent-host-death family antitoxin [Sandaracinobacteroides saxicola]
MTAPLPVINMHEAKTHLSRLVADAAAGKPFIIARAGKPLVKVVPADDTPLSGEKLLIARGFGALKGRFVAPDDIKTPFRDEIEEMFGLRD